jgi:hypothetical protein
MSKEARKTIPTAFSQNHRKSFSSQEMSYFMMYTSRLTWVLRHSVKLRTLPQDTSPRERVEHPRIPGYCVTPSNYVLYPRIHRWESVSRIRFHKIYSDLDGMMTSPTQCTMQCRSMTMEARLEIWRVALPHCHWTTKNSWLTARLCLFKTHG